MKRLILALVIVVIVAASVLGYLYYDNANRDFTPWMSELELSLYMQKFDTIKPGQPDWKKTHWLTAAEGRWHDGIAEYRIRYADVPKGIEFTFYWDTNMSQAEFSEKIQAYSKNGFALVYSNSYNLPDGTKRYQGVWHKPAR
jgi:hypothetical protein